jgi:glucose-1-phosphate thymidylyltransferase
MSILQAALRCKSFLNMKTEKNALSENDVVGVIPAAGFASRISPIPCSKEIYPVAFTENGSQDNNGPKVVASYLLENMYRAGVENAYMIIRKEKWDIPQFFGTGYSSQPKLAYLSVGATAGAPYTIDEAYSFVKDKTVVFGFPDIMMKPDTVFQTLLKNQRETQADITLALFKVNDPAKADMVKLGEKNRVLKLEVKPQNTTLVHSWMAAVWNPDFTEFMHAYLQEYSAVEKGELFIGNVIQQALKEELQVQSVVFTEGACLDIGTKEGLDSIEEWIEKNDSA